MCGVPAGIFSTTCSEYESLVKCGALSFLSLTATVIVTGSETRSPSDAWRHVRGEGERERV